MMNRSPYITPIFRIESIFSNKKVLWEEINLVVQKKHVGFTDFIWPKETFITCEAWQTLLGERLEPHLASDFTLDLSNSNNRNAILASLMTLCPWRYSQNCYHLNEVVCQQVIADPASAVVSPKHFNNMTEWTTCIPLTDIQFANRKVFNFYAHKTCLGLYPNKNCDPNCLILTFNIEPEVHDTRLITKDRNFKPMPYVILRADKLQDIDSAIIGFGAFPMQFSSAEDFLHLIKPFISMFNTIFDPITLIESEFVGVKKPHYSDIQTNINFNDLNFPTVKHLAPSNVRSWQVGHNVFAKLKQRQRREALNTLPRLTWTQTETDLVLSI